MTLFVASALVTLACLGGLLAVRAHLRHCGVPAHEIGRRALATPVGLVCFWGAILGAAITFTALGSMILFG